MLLFLWKRGLLFCHPERSRRVTRFGGVYAELCEVLTLTSSERLIGFIFIFCGYE